MPEVRQNYEQDHIAYLRAHQSEILLAGGLREGPESPFTGGLWVLAAVPRQRAVELVEQDLYFVHSKRGYRLLQWGKANPEIPVTL